MKKITTLKIIVLILGFSTAGFTQKTVSTDEIVKKIKNGESVTYDNVIVDGPLDFTFYFEKKYNEEYSRKKSKWNDTSNSIEETINSKITFTNCTFSDDVLAYINDDITDLTFTASFTNTVIFSNCIFEKESAFKYSEFSEAADFSGSRFNDEALFKYAKFENYADFRNATFDDDANFKYAKFKEGLDFTNTRFRKDLNLKYARISGDFKANNMDIQDDLDVKYTEINGDSFSKYLLKSR